MAAIYPQTWEQNLLALAHPVTPSPVPFDGEPITDPALLARAYAYCDSVTAEHSRSFHLASQLLPRDKRRAIRALRLLSCQ